MSGEGIPAPYMGPVSFQAKDRAIFFGRDREARELAALLVAERIVLMHSPSGAGKSSLIQAKLPELLEKRFEIAPVVRVNRTAPPAELAARALTNRYVESALRSLGWAGGQSPPRLAEYCLGLAAGKKPQLLVFDQFEEVLTLDPTDGPDKEAFFEQLGELLAGCGGRDGGDGKAMRWALFAMREEYLGALEPYFPRVPTQFRTRFRLDRLTRAQARDAIVKPAAVVGVTIDGEVADEITRDLSQVRVVRPGQGEVAVEGPHVEPAHLQVVCLRLWDRFKPKAGDRITLEQLNAAEDGQKGATGTHVERALAEYYREQVKKIAGNPALDVSERQVRFWIDDHLITARGLRGHVEMDPDRDEVQGLSVAVIAALQEARLLRVDDRDGQRWLELSHDRLVRPIKDNNENWYGRHLTPWQRLKRGWRTLSKKEQNLAFGVVLALAAVGIGVLVTMLVVALRSARAAERNREAAEWIALAVKWEWDDPEAALVAAKMAADSAEAGHKPLQDLLVRGSSRLLTHGEERYRHTGSVVQAVVSSQWVVTAGDDGKLLAWHRKNLREGSPIDPPLLFPGGPPAAVTSLAYDEETGLLAVASQDRAVRVWSLKGKGPEVRKGLRQRNRSVNRMAFFRPEGSADLWLAAVSDDAAVYLWRMAPEPAKPVEIQLNGHQGAVTCLAVDCPRKARRLATAGKDSRIVLWDLRNAIRDLQGKGRPFVVGRAHLEARFKKPKGDKQAKPDPRLIEEEEKYALTLPPSNDEEVTDLEFFHGQECEGAKPADEAWLVSAGTNRELCLWWVKEKHIKQALAELRGKGISYAPFDVKSQFQDLREKKDVASLTGSTRLFLRRLKGHTSAIVDIAISARNRFLLSGGQNGEVFLWNLPHIRKEIQEGRSKEGHSFSADNPLHGVRLRYPRRARGFVTDIALTADEDLAVIGTTAGSVAVWQLGDFGKEPARPLAEFEIRSRIRSLAFYPGGASVEPLFAKEGPGRPREKRLANALLCSADDCITRVWSLGRLEEDSKWEKEADSRSLSQAELAQRFDHLRAWKYSGWSDAQLGDWIKRKQNKENPPR